MKKLLCLLTIVALAALGFNGLASDGSGKVVLIEFNDIVHSISADFVLEGIRKANSENAELIIIEMQTPGGLSSSMEEMIQGILASKVPVVGYVSPSGSKAASAGYYILMACDVAVMAPGTRTGAATPVMIGGGGSSDDENFKTLMNKVKGDSRAFLRSLVRGRLRNPDIPIELTVKKAEEAIDKSEAYTEQEALQYGMIDFTAKSVDEILKRLDGREIRRYSLEGSEPRFTRVETASASIERVEMDFRQQFLSYLSNPMVALLLGSVGMIGLYIEFTHPGLIMPGAVGAICLVLAAISFQILSVNWAGLLMIGIAIVLFILEFNVPSFGMLTVGGIICLIIGGLILFEGPIPELRLNLWQIIPFAAAFSLISLFLLRLVIKAHLSKVETGKQGLVGAVGTIRANDKIFVHGEIWNVSNPKGFAEGDKVAVEKIEGLALSVKKVQ